ncbi:hypothetical protein PXNS11_70113 [Stutzerimonas xanthomarina]|nr:hypothetical protein PXNS11_70113 [Stutzerimonas xanthomarina]
MSDGGRRLRQPLTEPVLEETLVSRALHPARGNALRVMQVGAGSTSCLSRLSRYRLRRGDSGQQASNCSDSAPASQARRCVWAALSCDRVQKRRSGFWV